ncbi:MAG: anthranilate phosphoribosyltransferase [Abditibacteriales bacterium]|nr:anthranilate phosphoribosyltransferase [Abditibacteriales bacterium]MDW8366595.1 anthranilate phosphoribosyltransferase [Abditibacteriales bacterium]
MRDTLQKIIDHHPLTEPEAHDAMQRIMAGEATAVQIAALLVALRMKGETVEEITGFARAMRAAAVKVEARSRPLVDTCGTGGDGSHTFNISTAAAFLAAGAGVKVAKHGNRAASSQCGSADVLEALGVNINLSPEQVARCIDEIGIGFLFARTFHPAMRHAAPVRSELGVRTVFNLLGPLTNPAGATRQVMGVFDARWVEPIAHVLKNLGAERAFVVHGAGGLDEISTLGETQVAEVGPEGILSYTIAPEDFGIARAAPADLRGGAPPQNAAMILECLSAAPSPRRDIALLNAAAAIVVAGLAKDLREGLERARHAADSGAAREKLEALRAFSQTMEED